MNKDTTYNGWTNRATWLVNLHLSNDQGLYDLTREAIAEGWSHGIDTFGTVADDFPSMKDDPDAPARFAARGAADALEALVGEVLAPEGSEPGSFATDLIGTALADVDWLEVAGGWLDDLHESDELRELPTLD